MAYAGVLLAIYALVVFRRGPGPNDVIPLVVIGAAVLYAVIRIASQPTCGTWISISAMGVSVLDSGNDSAVTWNRVHRARLSPLRRQLWLCDGEGRVVKRVSVRAIGGKNAAQLCVREINRLRAVYHAANP